MIDIVRVSVVCSTYRYYPEIKITGSVDNAIKSSVLLARRNR
jgi:hypothetical protein